MTGGKNIDSFVHIELIDFILILMMIYVRWHCILYANALHGERLRRCGANLKVNRCGVGLIGCRRGASLITSHRSLGQRYLNLRAHVGDALLHCHSPFLNICDGWCFYIISYEFDYLLWARWPLAHIHTSCFGKWGDMDDCLIHCGRSPSHGDFP